MGQTFGGFIRQKRSENMIRLNAFARLVGISNVYLSYIEAGKRPAPSAQILESMAQTLRLNKDEVQTMYSLASMTHAKKTLPGDLGAYIMERPYITETLMTAKENDTPEEDWLEFKNKITLLK